MSVRIQVVRDAKRWRPSSRPGRTSPRTRARRTRSTSTGFCCRRCGPRMVRGRRGEFRIASDLDGERLIGLLPFERRSRFKGLPAATFSSWRHSAYLLCTPLVRARCGGRVPGGFLRLAAARGVDRRVPLHPVDGAFHAALSDATRNTPCTVVPTAQFSRALLRKGADAESYMQDRLPGPASPAAAAQGRGSPSAANTRPAPSGPAATSGPRSSASCCSRRAAERGGRRRLRRERGKPAFRARSARRSASSRPAAHGRHRLRAPPGGAPRHDSCRRRLVRVQDRVRRVVCAIAWRPGRASLPARVPPSWIGRDGWTPTQTPTT